MWWLCVVCVSAVDFSPLFLRFNLFLYQTGKFPITNYFMLYFLSDFILSIMSNFPVVAYAPQESGCHKFSWRDLESLEEQKTWMSTRCLKICVNLFRPNVFLSRSIFRKVGFSLVHFLLFSLQIFLLPFRTWEVMKMASPEGRIASHGESDLFLSIQLLQTINLVIREKLHRHLKDESVWQRTDETGTIW